MKITNDITATIIETYKNTCFQKSMYMTLTNYCVAIIYM